MMKNPRKWALRFCFYSVICDLSLVVLYWRNLNENLETIAVFRRSLILYVLCILFAVLAFALSLNADRQKLAETHHRKLVYGVAISVLALKAINFFLQGGHLWIYLQYDIPGYIPYNLGL